MPKDPISLYFHIPFCSRKCDYCHFYVLPDDERFKIQLMHGLELEWKQKLHLLQNKEVVSVYFGGGTPSLLGPQRVKTILDWICGSVAVRNPELTMEANPENITLDMIQGYAAVGINRMSIGLQSLDDQLLKRITRQHNAEKAIEAVNICSKAGIHNISVDLMYDLPAQSLSSWKETLKKAVELPITHLSLYNLTIEPHTVFHKKRREIDKLIPDGECSLKMYEMSMHILEEAGLKQYEISAFAKEGCHSLHNTGYWTGRPFLGYGPSAFSYWAGKRFRNVCNQSKYVKALENGEDPADFQEELDPEAKKRELFVIQLRLRSGVDLANFENVNGSLLQETKTMLDGFTKKGFLDYVSGCFSLTKKGMLFYDSIAAELI